VVELRFFSHQVLIQDVLGKRQGRFATKCRGFILCVHIPLGMEAGVLVAHMTQAHIKRWRGGVPHWRATP
jgi:hypothetical protein